MDVFARNVEEHQAQLVSLAVCIFAFDQKVDVVLWQRQILQSLSFESLLVGEPPKTLQNGRVEFLILSTADEVSIWGLYCTAVLVAGVAAIEEDELVSQVLGFGQIGPLGILIRSDTKVCRLPFASSRRR